MEFQLCIKEKRNDYLYNIIIIKYKLQEKSDNKQSELKYLSNFRKINQKRFHKQCERKWKSQISKMVLKQFELYGEPSSKTKYNT